MKKNKKVSLSKKPFLVLSRRAIAGWLGVIFILCAWMFIIGVLVGRGTAPVKFDIDDLQSKLAISKQDQKKGAEGQPRGESSIVKDKTKLDFYEALPQDREDTKIEEKKLTQVISKKVTPLADKKASETTGEKATKKNTPKKETGETIRIRQKGVCQTATQTADCFEKRGQTIRKNVHHSGGSGESRQRRRPAGGTTQEKRLPRLPHHQQSSGQRHLVSGEGREI